MPKKSKRGPLFYWGETTFKTRAETEKAIASFCADYLCQADSGSVRHRRKSFQLCVRVQLVK